MVGLKSRKIHSLNPWRKLLLWPLAAGMRLWSSTLRVEMDEESQRRLREATGPTILVFWHNRLFVAAELYRRFRRDRTTYCLISASRDGAWLADFMALNGMRAIRGSSSRRGREALRELESRLREGCDVGITPDGPRGPAYSFKAGAPMLAARTRARVLLFNVTFSAAWRLRSWDRFYLPRPFSRLTIRLRLEEAAADCTIGECSERWRRTLLSLGPPDEAEGEGVRRD